MCLLQVVERCFRLVLTQEIACRGLVTGAKLLRRGLLAQKIMEDGMIVQGPTAGLGDKQILPAQVGQHGG